MAGTVVTAAASWWADLQRAAPRRVRRLRRREPELAMLLDRWVAEVYVPASTLGDRVPPSWAASAFLRSPGD